MVWRLVCGNKTARQIFEMGLLDVASIQILEPCLRGSEVCALERNPTGSGQIISTSFMNIIILMARWWARRCNFSCQAPRHVSLMMDCGKESRELSFQEYSSIKIICHIGKCIQQNPTYLLCSGHSFLIILWPCQGFPQRKGFHMFIKLLLGSNTRLQILWTW